MIRLTFVLAVLATGPAFGATGTDPDWPCIQRKQPHLSMGQVWTGPIPDEAVLELARDPQIAQLAERLEQRRLPMPDAEAAIAEFAETAGNAELTALMQAIFERIERDRGALIAGIARYGQAQQDMSQRIEDQRAAMAALEAAEPPDFDAIDAAETTLDWEQRIFTERGQSLTYVCETPVILEQRVFALGRAIVTHLD
ncbi:hypothetical protein PANO111632_06215 [Paracoccus nototheniae]|uniref:Uncharacterized protein n=1 Tax=Paracoccus nototheniae TaxID=2489002 RepID=A0ABW4DTD3_9RHOB|nr:hypothetical protein [Paracoccus nototheniae]